MLCRGHRILHVRAEGVHNAHYSVQNHVFRVRAVRLVVLGQFLCRSIVDVRQAERAQGSVRLIKVRRMKTTKTHSAFFRVFTQQNSFKGKRPRSFIIFCFPERILHQQISINFSGERTPSNEVLLRASSCDFLRSAEKVPTTKRSVSLVRDIPQPLDPPYSCVLLFPAHHSKDNIIQLLTFLVGNIHHAAGLRRIPCAICQDYTHPKQVRGTREKDNDLVFRNTRSSL